MGALIDISGCCKVKGHRQ